MSQRNILKLYPAYGRQYQSPESLKQDWEAGKDFSATVLGGPYTSARDFDEGANAGTAPYTHVLLKDVRFHVENLIEVNK